MVNVKDVAIAIRRSLQSSADAWKVQKLAYYAQSWSLAWTGKPLFASQIQAWRDGPVCPDLRDDELRGMKLDGAKPGAHNEHDAMTIVASVVEHYGHLTRKELVDLTHAEAPWKDVYAPWANYPITMDSMLRFYTQQAASGGGPRRPASLVQTEISEDAFMALASVAMREWQETLAILAR